MLTAFYKDHFEWTILLSGLIIVGLMNPYINNGPSFCLLEALNFAYCPGEGLGHSIAFTFRGDLLNAFEAHPFGPVAIIILSGRILYLWNKAFNTLKK